MTTFEAPDYIIGNSATITASLSSVLTQLDQALQALEPAPNATTVKFNNTLLLDDGLSNTNTLNNGSITIADNSTNQSFLNQFYFNIYDGASTTTTTYGHKQIAFTDYNVNNTPFIIKSDNAVAPEVQFQNDASLGLNNIIMNQPFPSYETITLSNSIGNQNITIADGTGNTSSLTLSGLSNSTNGGITTLTAGNYGIQLNNVSTLDPLLIESIDTGITLQANQNVDITAPNGTYINTSSASTGDGTIHSAYVYTDALQSQSGSSIVCNSDFDMNNNNIGQVGNINLNTINGMSPTTIGLTWANILDQNLAWTQLGTSGYGFNDYSGKTSYFNIDAVNFASTGYNSTLTPIYLQFTNTSYSYSGYITTQGSNTFAFDSGNGNLNMGDINDTQNKTKIQTNDAYKEIDLLCVDLLNGTSGGTLSVMTPTFTNKQSGTISYGGGNGWSNVANNTFNIPDPYFTQTNGLHDWKIDFALNCRNMSNQSDKALAIYIEILDNNFTSFVPFNFNLNTPFTTHKNNSTYTQTDTQSENYCWSDYVNFSGTLGTPLSINLWWSADNPLSCDFSWTLSMTKTNVV